MIFLPVEKGETTPVLRSRREAYHRPPRTKMGSCDDRSDWRKLVVTVHLTQRKVMNYVYNVSTDQSIFCNWVSSAGGGYHRSRSL